MPPTPRPPIREGLTAARVQALLARWLEAQNSQNFGAYTELYAKRFTGIKRVGNHVRWFSRKNWLDDRKPMFRPGLHVEASDVTVALGRKSDAARVVFTQTFSVAKFHDVGRKELVVVEHGDELVIAREEMLTSRVASAGSGPADLYGVIEDRVIFPFELPDAALASAPKLTTPPSRSNGAYAAERELDAARLPPAQRAWIGKTLHFVDDTGSVCDAHVTGLAARVQLVPHFGQVGEWNGTHGTAPASSAQIAESLWSGGNPNVVGTVDGCRNAVLATPDDVPALTIARSPDSSVSGMLWDAFRRLPEYAEQQRHFREETPDAKGRWEDGEESESRIGVFDRGQAPLLAVVSAAAGLGCGGFYGALSVLFEIDRSGDKPRIVRHAVFETSDLVSPLMAFDADGDGSPEILSGPDGYTMAITLWPAEGTSLTGTTMSLVDYQDCPC